LKTIQKILIVLILQLLCIQQNTYAQDTIAIAKPDTIPVKHKFTADPLRATMLAVSFPGLGQIYNRKYWKIPVVYAGFAGLIYSIRFNSSLYTKYMKAFQDFTDAIPATNSYLNVIPSTADQKTYDPVVYPESFVPANKTYWEEGMLRMVDYYKRYRDLSYIGIAGWYLFSILDANVDASLFNYDVSPNLDLSVYPMMVPLPGGFTGAGLNLSVKVIF